MAPRTTTIQNSIEIDRPAELVFDYCVEPANEPEWNPRTRWIRRLGRDRSTWGAGSRVSRSRAHR